MDRNLVIQEEGNSRYLVFDGELLLACFGSKSAAEDYVKIGGTGFTEAIVKLHALPDAR